MRTLGPRPTFTVVSFSGIVAEETTVNPDIHSLASSPHLFFFASFF